MPIPSVITDLSTDPASNSPTGNENPIEGDNHIRTAYAFIRTLYNDSLPLIGEFGAVGDGVTDDYQALQDALDSNRVVLMPPGKYRITQPLIVDPARNRNNGVISLFAPASRYPYTTQTGGPTWDGTGEAVIFYDGATSTSAACIAASAEAVGTEPTSTFDNSVWTFTLQGVTLDANSKAGYGLYTARVQDLQINHTRARGATVAGMSINGTYSGCVSSVRCYLNPGRGFELGAADDRWSWTTNDKINALRIFDLHCDANGSDSTFRESDPTLRKANCGVYFGPHRNVTISGCISENNFGANVVFEPTSFGNKIDGLYTELGCKYAPGGAGTDAVSLGYATQQWGLMFIGATAGYHNRVCDYLCSLDHIWLTGTSPSAAREEGAFELQNVSGAGGLTADWAAYRLVNCAVELETITGTQPAGAYTIKGGLQFGAGLDILNYYDEGTFSPTLEGSTTPGTITYSVNVAAYTRIGRHVFVTGRFVVTGLSTAAGNLVLKGLPFTVRNGNNYSGAFSLSNVQNMTTAVVSMSMQPTINTTDAVFYHRTGAATGETQTGIANVSATLSFNFSGHYITS